MSQSRVCMQLLVFVVYYIPDLDVIIICHLIWFCKSSGKTSLVNQIKGPLKELKGYLIRGKFDISSRPDSILNYAFNEFFGDIIKHADADEISSMKSRIQSNVGPVGCNILMESMPNLQKLLGMEIDKVESGDLDQWKFLLCKLIAAVSIKAHPIVFFMDDLQCTYCFNAGPLLFYTQSLHNSLFASIYAVYNFRGR